MSAIDNLPPLREVIATHGLSARKQLGQNFLLDLNLTMKIARDAGALEECRVIEVGPGPGGLTRALLASNAKQVRAIEMDQRCLDALDEIRSHYPERLEIIHADATEIPFEKLIEGPTKIVANLPYNVATVLLTNWLSDDQFPSQLKSMNLMFQKEVAERICATPNTKAYGRLSILAQWRCHAAISFEVARTAFVPAPKVTSAIVQLTPRSAPLPCDVKKLEMVSRHAFGQRRKMLRASLKPLGGEKLLEKAQIDPTKRAEALAVEDFIKLANLIDD